MWLGICKNLRRPICERPCSEEVKIFGIHFSAVRKCDNAGLAISKIDATLKERSQRNLSHKGRVTVTLFDYIQTYLPNGVGPIIEKTVSIIQNKIMKYICCGHPATVSRDTLYQNVKEGGLNAPNIIFRAMRRG